jgi:hypothetical protein
MYIKVPLIFSKPSGMILFDKRLDAPLIQTFIFKFQTCELLQIFQYVEEVI